LILQHLELRPLLDLEMRLGEGTGAVLAMNLIDASICLLREMATFEGAGVTNTGV
jgi:nicotinate-nucleotide--dimethylbenzimidazole phosphoribosyltransferase